MRRIFTICALIALSAVITTAQKPKVKRTTAAKTAAAKPTDVGTVSGKTYTSTAYHFQVTFPETWLIPDKDFERAMLNQGIDLRFKLPPGVGTKNDSKTAPISLKILLTAYSALPGTPSAATARISVEDLSGLPQVKDAVDYFDLMRLNFQNMKTPAGFKYSETQAEKLGAKQFAYLDTSSKTDKRRMYATVRGRNALLFTLIYHTDEDLQAFRDVLANGEFKFQ